MGIYGTLTYSPVWTGEPLRIEGWRTAHFYCPSMPELQALFPNSDLAALGGRQVRGEQLAAALYEGLWACAEERTRVAQPDRNFSPQLTTKAQWENGSHFERKAIVQQLAEYAGTNVVGLRSLLLQGSLADGGIVEGYSDCDIIAILKLPGSKEGFASQISSVLALNDFLLAYHPLMHHGPMLVFEQALSWATEASLPSAILGHSVLLAGDAVDVSYVNGDLEAGQSVGVFENFFDRNFLHSAQMETAFDALWWISCTSLAPCLTYQAREGGGSNFTLRLPLAAEGSK